MPLSHRSSISRANAHAHPPARLVFSALAQSLTRLIYLSRIHAHFSLGTVCDRGERVCDVFGPDRGSHVLSANDWASESRVPSFPPRMHTCVRAQVAAEARYITTSFRRIDDPAFALSHDDMPPYSRSSGGLSNKRCNALLLQRRVWCRPLWTAWSAS